MIGHDARRPAAAPPLVHRDPGRAEQELREIYSLVSDTITQTKELVYAQRRLNLPAELENAKNLFEAAGIKVHIRRVACTDSRAGELLGQVLRETTTNILRHAQAREVRITLSESGISIVNDGVPDKPLSELSGLAVLEQRDRGSAPPRRGHRPQLPVQCDAEDPDPDPARSGAVRPRTRLAVTALG
ncbi:two-component system, NarL family, sensor histidine kinase DesK [Streptomyces sp. MnatMP-M27]|nr:two-component system, NarL family, sensor histidine kinase DesK [Streptomyces sp. MnatMP-M27]